MSMIEEILTIARETLEDKNLSGSSRLQEGTGYDSMAHVQFVIELEAHFNMKLKEEEILPHYTLEEIMNFIKRKRG